MNSPQPLPIWVSDPGSFGVPFPVPVTQAIEFARSLSGVTDYTSQITSAVQDAWNDAVGTTGPGQIPQGVKYIAYGVGAIFLLSMFMQGGRRR